MARIINVNVGSKNVVGVSVKPTQSAVHISTGSVSKSAKINPGSVVIVGKSPYINEDTMTWMVWDDIERGYIDTGVTAVCAIQNVSDDFYLDDGTLQLNGDNAAEEIGLGLSTLLNIKST